MSCRASRLRWPGEPAGSASSLPTNNNQQQPPYPRLWFRESYFSTSAPEHKLNLDTPVLLRVACRHETSVIGSYHAGDHHLLQLGRLKLDYYGRLSAIILGERSVHKNHVASGTPSTLPQVSNRGRESDYVM